MKTAISIPDQTFRKADRAAKRLGLSRSEWITKAIEKSLREEDQAQLTARMNEVCRKTDTALEPDVINTQARAVGREKW